MYNKSMRIHPLASQYTDRTAAKLASGYLAVSASMTLRDAAAEV